MPHIIYCLEILAYVNNTTWYCRKRTDSQYWEDSYTYFDADLQVQSVNNSTARPVAQYISSPGGNNKVFENLIWLISTNRDQSLLMLHQHLQGMTHKFY